MSRRALWLSPVWWKFWSAESTVIGGAIMGSLIGALVTLIAWVLQ